MDVINQLAPLLIILGVFYLLVWKPQEDERKAHESLVASLAKDDKVILKSGIHGRIHKVADTTLELEVAQGTRIVVDKLQVVKRDAPAAETKA